MKKVLVAAIALIGYSTVSNAQTSASAETTASATIVAPIQITKGTDDLNFGLIASSVGGGTVTIAPADASRTASGVTLLTSTTVNPTVPEFTVTGTPGYVYDIAAIPDVTLTEPNSSATMVADDFTTNLPTTQYQGTLTGGTSTFKVGATLTVGANQAAGVYVSSNFEVTVSYN